MLLFCEVIDLRCLVFVINAAFPSISFNVCDLVDGKCMSFVNGGTVELLGSCDGLLGRLVFDESVARQVSLYPYISKKGIHTLRSYPYH